MIIRDLKQNSRGRWRQRRQNNKTNYTRQKAHVNMWNKADICAVLLSNETSTAPFPHCLQNVTDISRTSIASFRRRRWSQQNFTKNRNIQGNQSKDVLNSKIWGLWINIFLASRCWCWRPHLLTRSLRAPLHPKGPIMFKVMQNHLLVVC